MGIFGPYSCGMCNAPLKKSQTPVRTHDCRKLIVCANCARAITARQSKEAVDRFYETGETAGASPSSGRTSSGCIGVLLVIGGLCLVGSLIRSCPSSTASAPQSAPRPVSPPARVSTSPNTANPMSAESPPAQKPVQEADEASEVSAPTPPPLRDGTVSMRIYKEILPGMTYTRVVEIIGAEGKLKESGPAVGGGQREVYSWNGRGEPGASFVGVFENGVLVSKAEFNLK